MALDPRIILGGQAPQIEGPLDTYGKALSLKSLMNQSQMQDLQRQQVEKQMAKEGRLSQIAKSSGGDQMRMRDLLRNEGLWQEANQLDESITRQSKTKREEEKAQIESTLKRFEAVGQLMNGVKDQASWENAIGVAVRDFGAKMTDFPPQYDPNFIEQKRQMALPVKEQLEQKWKALNFDLDNKKFDYQQTNDAANRGVQIRGQDLSSQTTIRGQNLTDARGAEGNRLKAAEINQGGKAPAGYRWTANGNQEPIPGGPADPNNQKKGSPTEDERKAAGWLAQANNAYKNMMTTMAENPGSESPGMYEAAYGAIGLDGAANFVKSAPRQKFTQAASSFAEATLRAATGAGVTKDEAKQKIQELTPLWTDSSAVKKQKLDSMKVYLESLKTRAGRAATQETSAGVTQPNQASGQDYSGLWK